jgi:DNA polymerase III subunit epsilon
MSMPIMIPEMIRPLATLDIETTGDSVQSDRIVEITAMKFTPAGDRTRLVQRLNPGIPISGSATARHGISDTDVEDCPRFEAIASHLAHFLSDCDLCGSNIQQFDLPFLLAEFSRVGIQFSLRKRAILDVAEVNRAREPRELMNLAISAVLVALVTKNSEKT